MQILFTSRTAHGQALRELAQRRVRFTLRRLTWLVPKATVRLSDLNGPRGGVDKRCQLELRTHEGGTAIVTAVASDWRTALDDALARAGRILMRQWRRGKAPRRTGQRAIEMPA